MNKEKKDILFDLVTLLSMFIFVTGIGVATMFYGSNYFSPFFIKDYHPDKILLGSEVILVAITLLYFLTLGMLAGSLIWIFCMGQILPYNSMKKWLTYGPQIECISKMNFKILNFVSRDKRHL